MFPPMSGCDRLVFRAKIMPPKVTTRSAGRSTTAPRGRRMGRRTGRGGGRTREPRGRGPVWGCDKLVSRAKVIENQVMAISVISISSDSSEDSVGTPAGRDPSSDHIPPLPATSPFLSSDDDTTDSDTPVTPPSPTHGTPFTEITASTQRSLSYSHHASSDSSSGHSLSDHSSPDLPSTSAGRSRKRRRSLMMSVPALSLVSGALSPVRADLIPSPKRIKDSGYLADVEVDPREIILRDDAIGRVSDEPHLEHDIDLEIQAEIDKCIAYADALRDSVGSPLLCEGGIVIPTCRDVAVLNARGTILEPTFDLTVHCVGREFRVFATVRSEVIAMKTELDAVRSNIS
ncbi:hypothetical protein Tco_0067217 [Tanacetum coccineum]